LFPYIYSYALRSRLESKHMLGKIEGYKYQYLFGEELLVAPVYERGATEREVYLPEGKWLNHWTGEILEGNELHVVPAPIHQIPLFVKQGAILPMRRYASSVEKGNNETIILEVYPGADGNFTLYEDDGTSNDYLSGIFAYTKITWGEQEEKTGVLTITPVNGIYKAMPEKRHWIINLHGVPEPSSIEINKKSLRFDYDGKKKVVQIDVPDSPCDKRLDTVIVF
jgi:alpha-glucosidase (family GH31 glycosyl hydrolase)